MTNLQQYTGDSRTYPAYPMKDASTLVTRAVVNGDICDFGTNPVPDARWASHAGPATVVLDSSVNLLPSNQLQPVAHYYNPGTGAPTSGTYPAGATVTDSVGNEFYTVAGGTPGAWVAVDSTSFAGRFRPSIIEFSGPSYLKTTLGLPSQDMRIDKRVAAMLNVSGVNVINRAVSGAKVNQEDPGGYVSYLQQVTRSPRGSAPYVSPAKAAHIIGMWPVNDLGKLVPSGDTGTVMTQVRAAIVHAYRAIISRARAAAVYEDSDASFSWGAGFTQQTPSAPFNSGTTYRQATATTNANFTITLPSDFPGGTISVGLIGAAGVFGGTITWSGTASQGTSGTTSTSNILPQASVTHGHLVKRITGLTSADAGKTIVGTVTAIDASGAVGVDYWQIEASNPPLVVVCNAPRLRDNAAYASFGNYWGNTGTPGSTGDADLQNVNADTVALIAEFDSAAVLADADTAMGKVAANYFASDGIHPDELGTELVARAVVDAIDKAVTVLPATQLHAANPTITPIRTARVSGFDYPPQGGSFTTLALSNAGLLYLAPFWVTEGGERFSQFGIEVTAAGTTSSVQLAIYNDLLLNGSLQLEQDVTGGTPLATTAAANTGLLTSINTPLDPGLYWLGTHVYAIGSPTATVRAQGGPMPGIPIIRGGFSSTTPAGFGVSVGAATALPKRISLASAGAVQGQVPLMTLRRT